MSPTEMISTASTWISFLIQCGTLIGVLYTAYKFTHKPEETQDARIIELEKWRASVDARLDRGNDHFEEIDQGNKITQKALLALMAHAINGNDIQKLEAAKNELESYLIDK